MLAEPTLQGFAERIAEDLPDDLAVLNEVQVPAFSFSSELGMSDPVGNDNGLGKNIESEDQQFIGAAPTNIVSLGVGATGPSYQVSFSQHFRQQLLAYL